MDKRRLDMLLVERGLAESRSNAQSIIMSGHVTVDGERALKPGLSVPEAAVVHVRDFEKKYVSRGGDKLEKALACFAIDVSNAICIDAGASTGGFTDCLLQHGASRVYAVDVGYGQLAWKLRNDARVIVLERLNVRNLNCTHIAENVDGVTVDVSFISLRLVLGPLAALLQDVGWLVALVKPQFEAGRVHVGKNGVVRDPAIHEGVLKKIVDASTKVGLAAAAITHSPLRGPKGNIEYFIHFLKNSRSTMEDKRELNVDHVVEWAHKAFLEKGL